jgi:hypothetical protein
MTNENPYYDWEIAIYEDKESEKIVKFASSGNGMSDKWWKETKRLNEKGCCMAFIKLHQD